VWSLRPRLGLSRDWRVGRADVRTSQQGSSRLHTEQNEPCVGHRNPAALGSHPRVTAVTEIGPRRCSRIYMQEKPRSYDECPVCHAPLKGQALSCHLDECPKVPTDGTGRFRRHSTDDKGSQVFCTFVVRNGKKFRPKKANVFSFKPKRKRP
jgi:hypothetical protein